MFHLPYDLFVIFVLGQFFHMFLTDKLFSDDVVKSQLFRQEGYLKKVFVDYIRCEIFYD